MHVLHWFQGLPAAPALILVCCYFMGLGFVLTWLGRIGAKKLGIPHNPGSLGPAISGVGTMASILIGLVIVSLWNDYRMARATVSSEATELRGAARDVQLLAPAYRTQLLEDLRRYTRALTQDEWPAMARTEYANSAGRALAQLTVDANTTRTQQFDLRARVNRLAEIRTTRLSQTSSGVVAVLWFALLTIPVVLLAGIGLVNDENPRFHYLLVSLVSVATSIAIFVAIEIDLPFHGIAALSPLPIANAIDQAVTETAQNPVGSARVSPPH